MTSALDTPSLRPVEEADEPLLLEIYSSTRMDEMALVPWNEEQRQAFLQSQFNAQQQHYRTFFSNTTHQIIEWNGQSIGRIYVARNDNEIKILDITILPQFRGHGLGKRIVTDLIVEARRKNLRIRIYVENYNPSFHLFERLGFRKIEEDGINLLLEWNPAKTSE